MGAMVLVCALSLSLPMIARALDPPMLYGTVTSSSTGLPISGAQVHAWDSAYEYEYWGYSEGDGSYEFTLPEGTYYIDVSCDGYGSTSEAGLVSDGASAILRDYQLAPLGSAFVGTVTDSVSGNPIVGATVVAGAYSDVTDANGDYEILATAGTYDLDASANGYAVSSESDVTFNGTVAVERDFALVKYQLAFHGTVTSSAGDLVAGALVNAYDAETEIESWTRTASDGTYEIYAPAGRYEIWVLADGYPFTQVDDVIFLGVTPVEKNFVLAGPVPAFRGLVTNSVTGQPIAGAGVQAWDTAANRTYTTTTTAEGTYEIRALAGVYDLTVWAAGYETVIANGNAFNGTTVVIRDFQLTQRPAAISGTVTDAGSGLPIAGAAVYSRNTDTQSEYTAYTAADGTYTIYALGGYYDMTVTAGGYADTEAYDVYFDGVTTTPQDFALGGTPPPTYTITPTAGAHGTITPGTPQTVSSGGSMTFTVAADSGYHIADVLKNGVSIGASETVEFTNVTADQTISATFAINTYTITPTAGAHGTITPGTPQTVNSGGSMTFEVAAAPGYHIADVLKNGVSVGASATVNFTNVTANQTISATFAINAEVIVENFSGDNRYDTTVLASIAAYPDGADAVVIATGANWPDALGGASLAGALDGPILLTQPAAVPASVMNEITRLDATKAVIIGGPPAVSVAVENALKAKLGSANVERLSGNTRYETANAVAARVIALTGGGFSGDAFIATGANFPDSLAASPIAVAGKRPLYLVPATATGAPALPTAVKRVAILGSTNAVNANVENSLKTKLGSSNVVRLGGTTRYETAAVIATYGVDHAGLSWDRVAITTGLNFPDALGGGVLQGKTGSVMLLTDPNILSAPTRTALTTNEATIYTIRYFGSTKAVTQAVRDAIEAILN